VSRETSSQNVPSFDHRVTQCRSTTKVSVGKSRNAFQSHLRRTFVPSSITNSQRSSDTCGVGPADKTGKSVVRYCPAGSFTSAALRRPEKPREMISIGSYPYRVSCRTVPRKSELPIERSSEVVCPSKTQSKTDGQDAARMTPAEQDLSLRGTVSQGEVSCGLVLKSSGRNTDNGDGCSTPLCNVLNVRVLPIKSDLYSVSVNPNETAARHLF
jgi:hypothetical protein